MRLPNKIISYKESIISKMPMLLKKLNTKSFEVIELYNDVRDKMSFSDYQDALVALFILGKIELIGEVLYYVERNIL